MSDVQAVVDLAQKAMEAHTVSGPDGREFLIVPEHATSTEITDPHGLKSAKPKYISQAVTLETVDLLVDYVSAFKGDATRLFANIATNTIVGIVDYHDHGQADHTAHRASMVLPHSEEWRAWTSVDKRLMPQLEFARFIEENAADVVAPSAGELLDTVRDLHAHRKVNFIKAVRTASDNENFEFTDETTAKTRGGLELPTKFLLNLPVYFGEPPVEVYAFLRWKLDDGQLNLGIQLHRIEHVRQAVFKQIVLAVGDRTGCPVVFGKASG